MYAQTFSVPGKANSPSDRATVLNKTVSTLIEPNVQILGSKLFSCIKQVVNLQINLVAPLKGVKIA